MPETLLYFVLAISAVALMAAIYRMIRPGNRLRLAYAAVALPAAGTLALGGVLFWYTHRPQPDDLETVLYQGVHYLRDARMEPRPVVIHVVTVDLDAPGLSFLVTPPESDGTLIARTTAAFLEAHRLQLAVNGDFYASPEDPREHPGNGEAVVSRGLMASTGQIVSRGYVSSSATNTLYISADNAAAFERPAGATPYNAISGWHMIVRQGQPRVPTSAPAAYAFQPQPRTVLALDEARETLMILVVDGRQPNYSEGLTLEEMAAVALEYGAYDALNMDGGGSVTLVTANEQGTAQTLNSPIHDRIPGRQRPVANHLGLYALPLGSGAARGSTP